MRIFLSLTLLFVIGQRSFSQKNLPNKFPVLTKSEAAIEEENHNCKRNLNMSFSNRLKKYPFNKAVEIQLVSFKGRLDSLHGEEILISDGLPRMNDTICYSKLYEVRPMTLVQIDKLTDIIYNYGFGGPIRFGSEIMCYNPRNAILFIDNEEKAFAFIEICFECNKTRQSSDKISLGQLCDQKLDLIKNLFKESKIEYGVTKGLIGQEEN